MQSFKMEKQFSIPKKVNCIIHIKFQFYRIKIIEKLNEKANFYVVLAGKLLKKPFLFVKAIFKIMGKF